MKTCQFTLLEKHATNHTYTPSVKRDIQEREKRATSNISLIIRHSFCDKKKNIIIILQLYKNITFAELKSKKWRMN